MSVYSVFNNNYAHNLRRGTVKLFKLSSLWALIVIIIISLEFNLTQ